MSCLENKVLLFWTAQNGYVVRNDALLNYLRTGFNLTGSTYDLDGSATASLQPRLVGGIAPNSKPAAANLNGEGRYFTHPEISFGAGDAWSVSLVLNYNGEGFNVPFGAGIDNQGFIINRGSGSLSLRGESGVYKDGVSGNAYKLIGKNKVLTLVYNLTQITVYLDGVFLENIAYSDITNIAALFKGFNTTGFSYKGNISAYIIQSQALTATEVSDLHTTLRSLYPEIESVDIGTQTWATRNFEAVATPMGNVISEMQSAAAVEKITNAADREFSSDTGFWTKNGDTLIDSDVCTFTGLGALNSSSSNWCLRRDSAVNANKYYIITVDAKLISGTGDFYIGFGYQYFVINVTSISQTYTLLVKSSENGNRISVGGATGSVFEIDNISYQELGWSNATEIYDAVYAATSGTAEEKEYAALKEASMWCYYNNDPDNGAIYGKLYNWYAAKLLDLDMQTAGFGWRVPTSAQFTTLANALGGTSVAGGKMKMTEPYSDGSNSSGFTALMGGLRDQTGSFSSVSDRSYIYAIDVFITPRRLTSDILLQTLAADLRRGFSIRLIKS